MKRVKRTNVKGKKGSRKKAGASTAIVEADENQVQDRNEFGILPNRNLKRNLGCG